MDRVFSERRRRSLSALSDVVIPEGGSLGVGAVHSGVPERIEKWVGGYPPALRRRFGLLLEFWDVGPVFSRGFAKRFHKLDASHQKRWVEVASRSRIPGRRFSLSMLRQLILASFASSPEFEAHVGYDYTCRLEGVAHGERSGD